MPVNNSLQKIKEFLLDLFFPKFCLGCNKEGFYLCEDCKATLDISEFDYCLCNKNPYRLPPDQKKHGKCLKCQDKKLSGLYFALPYKDPSTGASTELSRMSSGQEIGLTKKLICQFKYEPYTKDLAKTLAGLIIEHLVLAGKNTDNVWNNSVLVPIPLDKNKLKSRGYNQSEELAKELSKVLKIPVVSDNLIKIKSTKPQMELKKDEREKNLRGVFAIKKPFNFIQSKKIFLVDDIYTTGSTMEECAKTLKEAGARSVWGIAIARES